MTITRIAALALATSLLAGCSLFSSDAVVKPVDPLAPSLESPIEEGPFPEYTAPPLPVFERSSDPAITAVHDLVVANYEAIKAEDWERACGYYSEEYIENVIIYIGGAPEGSTCVEALKFSFGGATTMIESFDAETNAEGLYLEQQLMPFFYTPPAISIDDSEITADNDHLVYVTSLAVHSSSDYAFKDDDGKYKRYGHAAPWLASVGYFARIDGDWTYIDTPEKLEFD